MRYIKQGPAPSQLLLPPTFITFMRYLEATNKIYPLHRIVPSYLLLCLIINANITINIHVLHYFVKTEHNHKHIMDLTWRDLSQKYEMM